MTKKQNPYVIALGFFDGVHQGHARLLRRVREIAAEQNLTPAVYTFDIHPINQITGHPLQLLNTPIDRAHIIQNYYGINEVILAHFDEHMMHMPWKTFISEVLIGQLNAAHLVAGWDYHFGYRGEGNAEKLSAEAAVHSVGCDILPKFEIEGITVSSTYIRKLVAQGEIVRANRFLGHPHVFSGVVQHGRQLGRSIGLPTVNLVFPPEIQEMKAGIYATRVLIEGKIYRGVTNIGIRPTVTDRGDTTVETHILEFNGDLYGRRVLLEFLTYLREEVKFSSIDALKNAIMQDILSVKALPLEQFQDFNIDIL